MNDIIKYKDLTLFTQHCYYLQKMQRHINILKTRHYYRIFRCKFIKLEYKFDIKQNSLINATLYDT